MYFELMDADPPKRGLANDLHASGLERNKRLVVQFFELAFNGRAPAAAVDRFTGPSYVQHGPEGVRSHDGFIASARAFADLHPGIRLEIRRVIAEGDYVVLHVLARSTTNGRDLTLVEIFRIDKGRIAEHWNVGQPVPMSVDGGLF